MSAMGNLYRRAAARCIVIEPHRDEDQLPPCSGCLFAVTNLLAAASASDTGGSAAAGSLAHGVAGSETPPVRAGGPS